MLCSQAASFTIASYSHEDIASAWSAIHSHFAKPEYTIRAAVFNTGHEVFKRFLDVTPEDVQASLQVNVAGAFAFSREAILSFKANDIEEPIGRRGALIFTGATAGLRGNITTSAFAASKFGVRALAQSLAKEFGKENIHVAYVSYYSFFPSALERVLMSLGYQAIIDGGMSDFYPMNMVSV